MLNPVKVFRPTKELCYKNGIKLTRIYTSKEVQSQADELFGTKSYIHKSVRRKTKKEIEADNAGLNRKD